jgi:hypothetical protein
VSLCGYTDIVTVFAVSHQGEAKKKVGAIKNSRLVPDYLQTVKHVTVPFAF